MTTKKDIPAFILGLGNILWADEGFGVRAVEAFHKKYALTDPTNVIADGGTLGMYLYDHVCRTKNLLIFDCCDFKGELGELRVLHGDEISLWRSCKLSPHQEGMNDLLGLAAMQLLLPEKITVIGIQPALLDDFGGSLSNKAKAKIPLAVELARQELEKWGVGIRLRDPDEVAPLLNAPAVDMEKYEKERPSEQDAAREGDYRFLYPSTKR
ncbi:MAG: HyaD/HybD family hydrogenase maturation endopeptidase [Burkholderiales bacterium]|nr:HyaD/HybD family hydrogenase maturation endopeptidase [Burkholderiales bacterium]